MNRSRENGKDRCRTRIAVYLIGLRGNTILLAKRHNTGHMDGYWSLVAGHVHEGESCRQAIIREMHEECGLILTSPEVHLIGAMHHNSHPFDYINFVFSADLTQHAPKNMEPSKCAALEFFDLTQLPVPMAEYIKEIIIKSTGLKQPWISEFGWEK